MLLGCQISIAKGLDKSVAMAQEIGANCFQFFTRNPRGGSARQIPSEEIAAWKSRREQISFGPIVGHLPYTVNMASATAQTRDFASQTIATDLERMSAIGADYLVVHPGSRGQQSREEGIKNIIDILESNFLPFAGDTWLLLETMSGHGSEIGSLKELGEIISTLGNPPRLGICIDTCHLFAYGYDLRELDTVKKLLEEIDLCVGLSRLKCVHVNDSKFPPGTNKDRHALVGEGHIGQEGLLNIFKAKELSGLPFILETPVSDPLGYKEEIEKIRGWLSPRA